MTLSHDVGGNGPAVLLLHSSACDRRMWDPQWDALVAAGYRVIRCDFRGFGETPPPDRPWDTAGDVAELLDELGVERAAVVASSYGGLVALRLAARRPETVASLALLCPLSPDHTPGESLHDFWRREEELIEAGDIDGAVELNVRTLLGPEADEATRDLVRRMQRHAFDVQLAAEEHPELETDDDLTRIEAPCLVVSGALDLADFREIAARLPARLRDARHVELPWAGHLPSLERPAELTPLLLAHLQKTHPTP
ncbi:alpha/beta fold hydrolase [Bailinhaonella thermotolerans]|uniref:Alpha/beta fold hydrolase n=1 Tax=Bailinhaonella thermotolerans TaxID=1070861 RepID=A0A3A4BI93_9ACTN|nr:alpha/beta hydrolase [Bailinhaonella thermotolerans]RJL34542.1 alpha/beta fold hydrolase [Bailinhaonella thermotolerans]